MAECVTGERPLARRTAPEPAFGVAGARIVSDAAVPTLAFRLHVDSRPEDDIRSIVLAVQIRIATARRPYGAVERGRLTELFGDRAQSPVPQDLLWTHASLVVPPFVRATMVDIPVACTHDMEIATAKYFQALDDGEVPLDFLFSGSVFYADPDGALQTCRISWDRQARVSLPVSMWKAMIERYYPGGAWLRLDRATLDRLHAWKTRRALPTWQATMDALLAAAEKAPQP
jgi:hypothetical protein